MELWQNIILAIVEGLTEYLPISSTGHLILTSSLMGISDHPFVQDYTVIVQFGAILSVVVLYWRRFFSLDRKFIFKLAIAFAPAGIAGFLFKKHFEALLGSVQVVGISLILGGIAILLAEKFIIRRDDDIDSVEEMTNGHALKIGLFQCLALVPGVSRSASTILGGLSLRLTRKAAAEFSFFLAVPTLTAATCYKLLKLYKNIEPSQISTLLIGNVISFVVGMITIRFFIGYLSRHGFSIFGYYRIAVGILILILL